MPRDIMSTEKNYEAESAPKTVEMVDQKDGAKVPENAEVGTKTEDTTFKGKIKLFTLLIFNVHKI